ncbi:plasmid segregation protein ParM [Roseateles asaccharophilus]|uniref:plasmid segregation protein ParM domain-containing protein n=1 Tax=Roseateles asaccharophilus TaxID=582607 RepID=UPI003833145D
MAKKADDKTNAPVVVGCDDGNAATDLVLLSGGGSVDWLAIPSRARSGIHGTTVVGAQDEAAVGPCYETDGVQFTVGDMPDAESARFDEYPVSPMNRSIVHHALRLAGLGGKEVIIATGLPLGWFYKGGVPNTGLIERKKASLMQPIRALDGSPVAKIVRHEVYAEGLAAWVDYAVDAESNLRAGVLEETIAVIDIGGRTTDCAVVLPGRRIDHARSGSADIGVLNVVTDVCVQLQSRFGFEVPQGAVEKALIDRQLKIFGKWQDIGKEIDAAVVRATDSVLREVNRRLGKSPDVDRFLLVGGGAYLFKGIADAYPNVVIPAQPELANARGFAKFVSL